MVQSTNASGTVDTLRVIFSMHRIGFPATIVSVKVNAKSFTAYEFKELIVNNGICHLTSPPYSPSSKWEVELAVRVVIDLLKKNVSGSVKKLFIHYSLIL